MMALYDWKNMPVLFRFYDTIPDQDISWHDIPEFKATGVNMVSYVKMIYDASGNRVGKIEYKP
jgi:hypothetical protein